MTSTRESQTSTNSNIVPKAWLAIGGLLLVGLVAGFGSFVGSRFASEPNASMTPIELHAATASNNSSVSMATGSITSEVEGLWLLDHETGKLQCWVLSPRTGAVAGVFVTNVAKDLDGTKGKPDLVMTTGNFFFTGGKVGNQQPVNSICYVANTTSGLVAGYSVRVNPTLLTRGAPQSGELTKILNGKIKEQMATRDQ